MDEELVREVKEILKPIHNWVYVEGRPRITINPLSDPLSFRSHPLLKSIYHSTRYSKL